MRCRACHKKLSCYIDDELSDRERRAVETHLASCEGCRAELERLLMIRRAFASRPGALPAPLFYERMVSRMEAEGGPASAWKEWRVFGRLAAAAVLLIAVVGFSLYWGDQQFEAQAHGIVSRYLEQSSGDDASEIAALYRSEVSRDAVLKMAIQRK